AVKDDGSEQDRNARRLIVLIHGYQNSEARAASSYDRFLTNLRSAAGRGERGLGTFWDFHWPGDHESKPFSVATYPVRVANARPVGELLVSDWIERLSDSQRVVIVGHS